MKYNIEEVNEYVAKGLVDKCEHKELPIAIYKYSRNCQFEWIWDNITMNMRGTVLDENGNLIARTFPKFFNIDEGNIPNLPFEVFEKLDGSLGVLFNYEGEWHLATQGSFYSDIAIYAQEILKRNETYKDVFSEKFTFLFEIIYPKNRIVCSYGDDEKLVLLAAFNTKSGREVPYQELKDVAERTGFECAKRYDGIKDLKKIKSLIGDNQEGFVIRFSDGTRVKAKGEEYVRLHGVLTSFSNLDIWRCLKEGSDYRSLMVDVPDEYDAWVTNIEQDLQSNFNFIEATVKAEYKLLVKKLKSQIPTEEERQDRNSPVLKAYNKEFFELVEGNRLAGYLLDHHRNKDYSGSIWNQIRPDYEKPFWTDYSLKRNKP
jgi:RNA ligase